MTVLAHAGRCPVLRRDVLPPRPVPPAARAVARRLGAATGPAVLAAGQRVVGALAATRAAARRDRCRPRPTLDRAVDAAGRRSSTPTTAASAGRRSSRRRWCWSSCCATHERTADTGSRRWRMAGADVRGDGPRRHLRPARRRVRPLLRRRDWVVPHFEKMLYDNALLLRGYLHWWRDRRAARRAGGARDGRLPAARAAHPRGRLRLRPRRGHRRRRGADLRVDAAPAAAKYSGTRRAGRGASAVVTEEGTFEHGASTLQLRTDPDDAGVVCRIRRRLLAARATAAAAGPRRQGRDSVERPGDRARWPRPARCSRAPDCLDAAARRAPTWWSTRHLVDGRLRRTSRAGAVGAALAVPRTTAISPTVCWCCTRRRRRRWLAARRRAAGLRARALRRRRRRLLRHRRRRRGSWSAGRAIPPTTPRRPGRRPWPVRCSTYAALDRLGRASRGGRGGAAARSASLAVEPAAVLRLGAGGRRGAGGRPGTGGVVGEDGRRAADRRSPGVSDRPARSSCPARRTPPSVPLLAGRPLVAGEPAAYVCRGFVCDLPVSTEEELARALRTG